MDRLERFYKIDRLLKERKVVSFAVFKSELGMSPASLKRDLAYMRDRFNAPIEYARRPGRAGRRPAALAGRAAGWLSAKTIKI